MPDRITADRAVAGNRDLTGRVSRAHALRATGPIGNDSIRQVAKVRTRDRFEKASTEQNSLAREPDHNVVARVACARKEQLTFSWESRRFLDKVRAGCRDHSSATTCQLAGQRMGHGRNACLLQGRDSPRAIAMKVRGHGLRDRPPKGLLRPFKQHVSVFGRVACVNEQTAVVAFQDQAVGGEVHTFAFGDNRRRRVQPQTRSESGDSYGLTDAFHRVGTQFQERRKALRTETARARDGGRSEGAGQWHTRTARTDASSQE